MKLPQLSLRDLFWLVLVVALAVGWWVSLQAQINLHRAEIRVIQDRHNEEKSLWWDQHNAERSLWWDTP